MFWDRVQLQPLDLIPEGLKKLGRRFVESLLANGQQKDDHVVVGLNKGVTKFGMVWFIEDYWRLLKIIEDYWRLLKITGWWWMVAIFGIFPGILGCCPHPNWLTHIFQRGGPTTNQNCVEIFSHNIFGKMMLLIFSNFGCGMSKNHCKIYPHSRWDPVSKIWKPHGWVWKLGICAPNWPLSLQ